MVISSLSLGIPTIAARSVSHVVDLGKLPDAMLGAIASRLPQRSVRMIDVLIVVWTAAWIFLGVTVGLFVERLGAVGEGIRDAGAAVGRAGTSVGELGDVPLVGGGFSDLSARIDDLGGEIVRSGRSIENDVDALAVLIGGALALGPTVPILALWVPPRVARERERPALRRALRGPDDRAIAYLAHRAVSTRLFSELVAVSDDPVADLQAGRYDALAALELDHLSLPLSGRRFERSTPRGPRQLERT
jgi:hypothetical protein